MYMYKKMRGKGGRLDYVVAPPPPPMDWGNRQTRCVRTGCAQSASHTNWHEQREMACSLVNLHVRSWSESGAHNGMGGEGKASGGGGGGGSSTADAS